MMPWKESRSFSLRDNCRLRILEDMLRALKEANPNVPNYILVVDDVTTRILSSTVSTIELLEGGVLGLEKLEVNRKPFPKMHAICFITPTEKSIELMCDDFSDVKKPTYGNIHVFLTNQVEKILMDKLTKKPHFLARLRTFKEINLDFLCPEANVFHLDMPAAFPVIFSKYGLKEERDLSDLIADKLATIVPSVFDYKNIHFIYNKNENNSVAEKVAKRVYQRVEKFLQTKQDDNEAETAAPIKIIILDRSFDPLTPILHDYYYQAMAHDLLKLDKDIVEYEITDNSGKTTKKRAMLSDSDDLWKRYKHKHIAEASSGISQEFEAFVRSNATTKAQQDFSRVDLKTMSEIVKNMPLYNELMSKYALHMNLLEQCLSVNFTSSSCIELNFLGIREKRDQRSWRNRTMLGHCTQ